MRKRARVIDYVLDGAPVGTKQHDHMPGWDLRELIEQREDGLIGKKWRHVRSLLVIARFRRPCARKGLHGVEK